MLRILAFLAILLVPVSLLSATAHAEENYPEHPDSVRHEGVPQGKVEGPFPWHSKIYPGTVRNYWVYVPAQYDGSRPVPVMIVQDGLGRANGWALPTVLDNLIHAGAVPVQLGIFIDHGQVPGDSDQAQTRFNRSFEYDSVGDRYARFLIEEILPEVGRKYRISEDPNDRLLAGASSGAIAAFNAAWHRPDAFRRVFSTIGTYVGLRGANEYPVLIRKTENKPLRIFLQDGSNDLNIYAGDWWIANQDMLSAFNYSGYDVNHVWGEGGHNGRQGRAIAPDALRWLWRGYPEPIQPGTPPNRRMTIVIPGEGWELVSEGHTASQGPAVAPDGTVYFADSQAGEIWRIAPEGQAELFVKESPGVSGLMTDAEGNLVACQKGRRRIVRYDREGHETVVAADVDCHDLVVMRHGIYWTAPKTHSVWYLPNGGQPRMVHEGIASPSGLIPTPDQQFLLVADAGGRFYWSLKIEGDGSLAHGQEYGYVHWPENEGHSGAGGMAMDSEGRVFLATRLGVQVFDQLGRCNFIVAAPNANRVTDVVLAGPKHDLLYATCGDKVFRRRIQATGVQPWGTPTKPPKPGL